jgi:hypothetical protein
LPAALFLFFQNAHLLWKVEKGDSGEG